MSSPNTPALQELHRLKGSSPNIHNQLSDVLYGEEYQQCVPILQGDDLVWLVDYLDKVCHHIAIPTLCLSQRRLSIVSILKCCFPQVSMRTQKHMQRAILPTSYMLLSCILTIGSEPFASGGYGDVYEGTLHGLRICVKRMRVYIRDGPKKATKVRY